MPFIGLSKPQEQALNVQLRVGDEVPTCFEFDSNKSYRLVAFLRHTGCPFAEHTVKRLRDWSRKREQVDTFIVSHGQLSNTQDWLTSIGGLGNLQLVVDPRRELYGRWGVGFSDLRHFMGLRSLLGAMRLVPKGIRNRSASGTRWQKAAMFAATSSELLWVHDPLSAEELLLPPDTIFS